MVKQCLLTIGVVSLVFCGLVIAQKPSFDVASVRLNKSESPNSSINPVGDRFVATNVTVNTLLVYAYRPEQGFFQSFQIVGAPRWTTSERFDVQAKLAENGRIPATDEAQASLQSLLEDRFLLKVHKETRQLPVYELIVFKDGLKFSQDQTPLDQTHSFLRIISEGAELGTLSRGQLTMITGTTKTTVIGKSISISTLLELLQPQSDRAIIDKTGASKLIDVHLEFSKNLTEVPSGPEASLFTALQEIGLKLKPGKAPMEVLVIDDVQHPSEN